MLEKSAATLWSNFCLFWSPFHCPELLVSDFRGKNAPLLYCCNTVQEAAGLVDLSLLPCQSLRLRFSSNFANRTSRSLHRISANLSSKNRQTDRSFSHDLKIKTGYLAGFYGADFQEGKQNRVSERKEDFLKIVRTQKIHDKSKQGWNRNDFYSIIERRTNWI